MLITDSETAAKSRTVCVTGPKPEKLPQGGDRNSQVVRVLKSVLYKAVLDSIEEGYDCFITGLTQGVELWAAEIILELKAEGENVRLVAASPYREHGNKFRNDEKFLLGNILLKADEVVYVSESYSGGCIQRRDKYMVDRSGKLIAIVSDPGSRKGTAINYAEQSGIITRIIDAKKLEAQIGSAEGSAGRRYGNFRF